MRPGTASFFSGWGYDWRGENSGMVQPSIYSRTLCWKQDQYLYVQFKPILATFRPLFETVVSPDGFRIDIVARFNSRMKSKELAKKLWLVELTIAPRFQLSFDTNTIDVDGSYSNVSDESPICKNVPTRIKGKERHWNWCVSLIPNRLIGEVALKFRFITKLMTIIPEASVKNFWTTTFLQSNFGTTEENCTFIIFLHQLEFLAPLVQSYIS